jgi:hypothetical protein
MGFYLRANVDFVRSFFPERPLSSGGGLRARHGE